MLSILVSYTCGTLVSGADFDASGAGVTIKTELYVIAEIKCANAVTHHIRLMDPTNIDTLSANIYYTNDGNGTIGTDCFFFVSFFIFFVLISLEKYIFMHKIYLRMIATSFQNNKLF